MVIIIARGVLTVFVHGTTNIQAVEHSYFLTGEATVTETICYKSLVMLSDMFQFVDTCYVSFITTFLNFMDQEMLSPEQHFLMDILH